MVNVVKAPDTDENTALQAAIAAADGAAAAPTITAVVNDIDDEDDDASWSDIPRLAGMALVQLMPELAPVYSDEACEKWGKAADKVARKWGWDSGGLPPEAMLLLSTAMFVLPTVGAIKARRMQPPPAAAPAPAPTPGASNAAN